MRIVLALLSVVLLAAGCGGGGSDDGGLPEGSQGTSTGADYEVFASEFAFAPPFLVVEKPGTYSVSLRNDGTLPHDLTIPGGPKIPAVQPGETKTAELTLKAGNYEFFCSIGNHAEQGMTGTLNVLKPPS